MNDYHVFYKRDIATEQRKHKQELYLDRMLFDKTKSFETYEAARDFAMQELPAYIVQATMYEENNKRSNLRSTATPYMVVAKHDGKHRSYDYTGDWDPLISYDAVRTSKEQLEETIEQMAGEKHVEKIIAGIELKLI
jgi:hypothetical protein